MHGSSTRLSTVLPAWSSLVALALGATACGASDPAPAGPPDVAATAPATTATPAPIATEAPLASAAPTTSASAAPAAPPAPPSARGRCPEKMVEVAGGKFKSSYYRAELPVESFCIDENLITTAEYTACVDGGKCDKTAVHACDPKTFGVEGRGDMPMICVDFDQSDRYCKAQGKRLVSDLEWEWAARGGEDARIYPWGNDPPSDQLCWSGGGQKRTTPCPSSTYAQGNAKIFDLAGNVLQWTTTTNDSTGSFRVGRGGSWKDGKAELVTITRRGGFKNTYRCGFLGIRCASAVPGAAGPSATAPAATPGK